MKIFSTLVCSIALTVVSAWTPPTVSRKGFLQTAVTSATGALVASGIVVPPIALAGGDEVVTLPSGLSYQILERGKGPAPDKGELVAIRFAAYYGDLKIDDIFDTPEPYYTRIGSGALLKGVEETLPLMQLGDKWRLTIPSNLAFGKQGRSASPGKPRIPGDATIIFDVAMVGLPGKEPELIELIGDY